MKVKITGTGLYLPPKVETSREISMLIGKSEEWIIRKSGVKERRVSEIDVDKMGAYAGNEALGDGPLPDLIINASGVPKQTIPDTSTFYQKEMGLKGIPSFSIHCTCLSFIAAFHTASSLIQTKAYKKILIISADRGTRGRNFNEPESASLLGDGAAAIILEPCTSLDSSKLMYFKMNTWPEGAHLTEVRGGGTNKHPQDPETLISDNLFTMDGPGIYKIARKAVYKLMLNTLKSTNLTKEDIDLVIPHQASGKAVEAYIETGGFKREKVVNIVSKFGNCVAASVPMALVKSIKEKKIRRKDKILLIGTGAGLSAACALLRY
ncbi:ketoacyl-ACP synthase III [Candidatus Marinimicrobia bacterium]|nr:ketoacyl-ACP synthase III [Candidatus Neomarinimicrobiota bacterium]MDC0383505.1 ketoacyl-ACP synthase III [Candidatus Neomarinimicrobiota bacterium]